MRPRVAFVAILLAGGAAVAALSIVAPPARGMKVKVAERSLAKLAPTELAQWIIEGRRDFVIVDLRDDPAYEAGHVRGAVHCGSCHEDKAAGRKAQAGEHFIDLTKKLVFYTDDGAAPRELPPILARNPRLALLTGGWRAWQRDVLAPVTFGGETDRSELEIKQRAEAIRAFMAGENATAPAPVRIVPVKRDGAHKAVGGGEGC